MYPHFNHCYFHLNSTWIIFWHLMFFSRSIQVQVIFKNKINYYMITPQFEMIEKIWIIEFLLERISYLFDDENFILDIHTMNSIAIGWKKQEPEVVHYTNRKIHGPKKSSRKVKTVRSFFYQSKFIVRLDWASKTTADNKKYRTTCSKRGSTE